MLHTRKNTSSRNEKRCRDGVPKGIQTRELGYKSEGKYAKLTSFTIQ